jgi:ubiquitin carboxyl-terminal hydrolase L5
VDDLYSLDEASLAQLQPIHALIFLFKWLPTPATSSGGPPHGGTYAPDFAGFFAHQVVNNACATLAVLNALGNIHPLVAGSDLAGLLEFAQALDPQTRGLALTSADWLRAAHNALSPPAVVSLEELGLKGEKEDAYHFVVYVPLHGRVWELDGLKAHAIDHGAFEEKGEGWLSVAR